MDLGIDATLIFWWLITTLKVLGFAVVMFFVLGWMYRNEDKVTDFATILMLLLPVVGVLAFLLWVAERITSWLSSIGLL